MERAMVSFERHAYQEGMQQGMQVGRQQGREEGLELGRRQTLINLICMVLRDRIHVQDLASYEEHLQNASLEQLQTWAQRCITASGVHEIFEH